MKYRHIECANTSEAGIYQVKLKLSKNETEVWHNSEADFYGLSRLLDKCEIQSFEVSLEPEKTRK